MNIRNRSDSTRFSGSCSGCVERTAFIGKRTFTTRQSLLIPTRFILGLQIQYEVQEKRERDREPYNTPVRTEVDTFDSTTTPATIE